MKVALGSAFRNSVSNRQFDRWVTQALSLAWMLRRAGHELMVIMAEGDSNDRTREAIDTFLVEGSVKGMRVDVTHGGPWFGSTEHAERFAALQGVGNGILEATMTDVDVLVYVESDLIWEAYEVLSLMERLSASVDVVAPLIFAGSAFYDIFAYRDLDGVRFGPFAPFHPTLDTQTFMEVSSAGSCLVMKGEVARKCRVDATSGLVGFCADARQQGFRIWVDSDRTVRHP